MTTIAIDLSEKPGIAVYAETKLVRYVTLFPERKKSDMGPYPLNYLTMAQDIVDRIWGEIQDLPRPVRVVLEETTASSQNYSQKILEFAHHALNVRLAAEGIAVAYIRDGVWKRLVGALQNKAERSHNSRLSNYKKKHNKVVGKLKDKDGKLKRARKLDSKDYAIRAVQDHFQITLERADEDHADAILIGLAYLMGAPLCDGTTDGGTLDEQTLHRLQLAWGMEVLVLKSRKENEGIVSGDEEPSHDPVTEQDL